MSILEISDIKKSFGNNNVLKGISFSIEEGEVLSVIGSSGSGKTTLLRCLNFLETADEGIISVDGNVIFDASDKEKLSEKEISKIVAEKLELVGLPGMENYMPGELSGGMKKRVSLARAIAFEPEIIFYDEPSSGLDPIMTAKIDELIVSTQKQLNVTSIVVTHDMVSACHIADRIAMIYEGELIAIDTVENFKKLQDERVQAFMGYMKDD